VKNISTALSSKENPDGNEQLPTFATPKYHDSHTRYVDMNVMMHHADTGDENYDAEKHALLPGSNKENEDHRIRFMSDAEKILAEHPMETRQSFSNLDMTDQKRWHIQTIEFITKKLETSTENGLSTFESEKRIMEYGLNVLEEDPRTPLYIIFLLQFYNLVVGMLLFAAVAALSLQMYLEGCAVLFIVILNSIIATIQENSAGNALQALAKMSSPQSTVIRDGIQQTIDSQNLVPGDIVVLVTGDVVPADLRLFKSVDFKVNEMLLTGETDDVLKHSNAQMKGPSKKLTADNMVFSSTTVTAGNGMGVVVETGMHTRVGSIAAMLKSKSGVSTDKRNSKNPLSRCMAKYQPKLTPLQRSLNHLGFLIGVFAISVCTLMFIVGMVRGDKDPKNLDRPVWLTMIMVAVSLAVSAVPEGLPIVVSICLSSGTADMVKKNVLVRKLAAVETLGAASVICTDKTGTLTEGKMTAVKMWGDFKEYEITGKGFNPQVGSIFLDGVSQTAPHGPNANVQVRSTLLACVLCSNTQIKQKEMEDGRLTWAPFGNSSEAPLIVAAGKAGIWEEYVSEDYPRLVEIPFSSSRKMMITVNAVSPDKNTDVSKFDLMTLPVGTTLVASVKGAPNYILNGCEQYCKQNGEYERLTKEQRKQIMQAVDNLSSKALRVLAVAIRPMRKLPFGEDCEDVDEKFEALVAEPLILLGLMASIDPERDGVRDAIAKARRASIRTIMITGDYLKTAVAIAKNIDLLQMGADPNAEATDCSELRLSGTNDYLPETDLDEITSRTLVFARAKPEDKIEIVKSLQRQGLIAAMTGDGVNDAPALKQADIGVAMGISGTEVAKGASDMVLTDDNFCSIVSAVEKGRVIYANIQKFVMFLLSMNIGLIVMIFIAISIGLPLPLEPLQILVVHLFSDGMPAVALSLETGDPSIMNQRPRPKKQSVIHGRLWFLVFSNAFFIAVGAMSVFMLGVYWNFGQIMMDDILTTGGVDARNTGDFTSVTCNRWEGIDKSWKLYGNCNAKDINGNFVFGNDLKDRSFFENATAYCRGGDYDCLSHGLSASQTMIFVFIALSGVVRAYTVRSFTEPVFVGICSNRHLLYASGLSLTLTILVTNTPIIMNDLFGFAYLQWFQWLVVISGALLLLFCAEMVKTYLRRRDRENSRWEAMRDGFEVVLMEIRHVRRHIEKLEKAELQ
jgi:potassium/sodium efflux P-type ATPase